MTNFYRLNFTDGTYLTMLNENSVYSEEISGAPGSPVISVLPNFFIFIVNDSNSIIEKTDLSGNVWKFEKNGNTNYWYVNDRLISQLGQQRNYYLVYDPSNGQVKLMGRSASYSMPFSTSTVAFVLNGEGPSSYPTLESCIQRISDNIHNSSNANIYGTVYDINDSISPDFYPVHNLNLYMMAGYKPHTFKQFFELGFANTSSSGYKNVGDLSETVSELYDVPEDPYNQGGESGPGGGTGTFSDTGDIIGEPSLPSLSAVDTGFIQIFNPNIGQLNSLANKLWSDGFYDQFVKAFENPMDVILGLSIVPVAVPSSEAREVTAGNINTGVRMNVASTQYVRVDCGSLDVLEFWGSYLDYNPYTKCWIYLPYVGIKPLDIDSVMSHNVKVVYHLDILSGACVAMVFSDGTQVATWAGQCASLIPVNGQNYSNLFSGLLGSVAGIGTTLVGALTANPVMVGAGVVGAVASSASIAKIDCEKSGSLNTTTGMLSVQTPYLIVERPRQAVPANQNTFTGYPSFITATLGELNGYTEVANIHLNDIPATDEELIEIDRLLKEGVII